MGFKIKTDVRGESNHRLWGSDGKIIFTRELHLSNEMLEIYDWHDPSYVATVKVIYVITGRSILNIWRCRFDHWPRWILTI